LEKSPMRERTGFCLIAPQFNVEITNSSISISYIIRTKNFFLIILEYDQMRLKRGFHWQG